MSQVFRCDGVNPRGAPVLQLGHTEGDVLGGDPAGLQAPSQLGAGRGAPLGALWHSAQQ